MVTETLIIKTPFASLNILLKDNIIYEASFTNDKPTNCTNAKLLKEVNRYFDGQTTKFTIERKIKGTDFQKLVWKEIAKIPYGKTKSYSQIAKSIGYPTSYRAVANACGQNKIALFIPCHRVVGKKNKGGYKWGTDIKDELLQLESVNR